MPQASRLQTGRTTGASRSHPESPLCDREYLDASTGSCLEPEGIPEDDLSLLARRSAAAAHWGAAMTATLTLIAEIIGFIVLSVVFLLGLLTVGPLA